MFNNPVFNNIVFNNKSLDKKERSKSVGKREASEASPTEQALMENLEQCDNATHFLEVANQLLNKKLKTLLPTMFIQDAVVYEHAVKPLLEEDGPLGTTEVMSKLLFALGKTKIETYSDIGLYAQVSEFMTKEHELIQFKDDVVYEFISNQATLLNSSNRMYIDSIDNLRFSSFDTFSQQKYESLIKTVLSLSLELLLTQIESELTK